VEWAGAASGARASDCCCGGGCADAAPGRATPAPAAPAKSRSRAPGDPRPRARAGEGEKGRRTWTRPRRRPCLHPSRPSSPAKRRTLAISRRTPRPGAARSPHRTCRRLTPSLCSSHDSRDAGAPMNATALSASSAIHCSSDAERRAQRSWNASKRPSGATTSRSGRPLAVREICSSHTTSASSAPRCLAVGRRSGPAGRASPLCGMFVGCGAVHVMWGCGN
jgi:hypothetical protein